MTTYSLAHPQDWPRVSDGRRRFDILTIGLHWATVTLIAGMFASAWLLQKAPPWALQFLKPNRTAPPLRKSKL